MQEEDIPVLTEVHVEESHVAAATLVPDLIVTPAAELDVPVTIKSQDEIMSPESQMAKAHEEPSEQAGEAKKATLLVVDERLKQYIADELSHLQQTSHAALMRAIQVEVALAKQSAIEQIKADLIDSLNEAQGHTLNNLQASFSQTLSKIEQQSSLSVRLEIEKLLDSVRLVLPK